MNIATVTVLIAALSVASGARADEPLRRQAAALFGEIKASATAGSPEAELGRALFSFGRYKAEMGAIAAGKDMLRDAIALFAKVGLARPAGEAEKLLATLT